MPQIAVKSGGALSGLAVYGWHASVFLGSRFWDLKSHYIMCYVTYVLMSYVFYVV